MKVLFSKYLLVMSCTFFLFLNFIACGAQMYQVNLENDVDSRNISESATDPESPEFGIHALNGWEDLPIRFKTGKEITESKKIGLLAAIKTWEAAVGRQLFEHVGTHSKTGDSFKDLYSSLKDSTNGHYIDNDWDKTKKAEAVLATTIWDNGTNSQEIISADIRYNEQYYIMGDSYQERGDGEREIVDMQTLALHELGHLLGLAHVSAEVDPDSIMNPSLFIGENLSNRKVSKGDIERIQKIYGCVGDACDIDELMIQMEYNLYDPREDAKEQIR